MLSLEFEKGTLTLHPLTESQAESLPGILWDSRTRLHRAPAWCYREIVLTLRKLQIPYQDNARKFEPQEWSLKRQVTPRHYQLDALHAWKNQGSSGVVVLPTGAGKTILAVLMIAETRRPALIHVPTIDLMHQWHSVLSGFFDEPIGMLGGGENDLQKITVATYDSALIHVFHQGHRFGFIIFDECHHLPGEQYQNLAIASIAPFRLGLTATPERRDGREQVLYQLCGPLCFQVHIHELEGRELAPYEIETIEVDMLPEEQERYEQARACYLQFLKDEKISFSSAHGWSNFISKTAQSAKGRQAFKAFLEQRRLSQASQAKEDWIWELLRRHAGERILVFTQENDAAYRIGKKFFLPVLTHHTKVKERAQFLEAFRKGDYPVLVTSKVLNEGVDVPEANVAIVVAGSGSVREHVQRLGRILRPQTGKVATLYELVSKGTGEYFVNQRRRQHSAYQRSPELPNL
ncbi:MAG: DEAD/DEAH box helicase family protein [SAR324 cluster bacterium]|nr:DEAD/DEAH box helicase family protein [SAR324 cluster bacterium]MBF0350357.1 DEAD/DEAH box helicase family protein [SAR324 cluster bacterium]